jgi:hypothetical protein
MLIEKTGYAEFYIHETLKDRKKLIQNKDYLTPQQEKMMATQPDMILQFAKHISTLYKDSVFISNSGEAIKFGNIPKVTAEVKVCLFNTGSRDFVKEGTNLSKEKRGFNNKKWIIPYEE